MKARNTKVQIVFDGADITKDIMPYLLSVKYTDNEEDDSDTLQFDLQDRGALWLESWLDKAINAAAASKLSISAVIKPENWGSGGGNLPTGEFELDSVEAKGPPLSVSISGVSLSFSSPIRQTKKTKAWENYKLSGIASEIASKGGLSCMYEASKDPHYKRVEQVKQSNIAFLSNLCHDAGISLKCSDGKLILFEQQDYESKPPVLKIKRGDGSYNDYRLSTGAAETQYGSCRVSWVDAATGEQIEGIATASGEDAGSGQRLEITARVEDAGEAMEIAEKNLRLHNKFNRTVGFSLPGNTALVAGVTFEISGFGGWNGKYMVKQAVHTVGSSGGYTTDITGRKVL